MSPWETIITTIVDSIYTPFYNALVASGVFDLSFVFGTQTITLATALALFLTLFVLVLFGSMPFALWRLLKRVVGL